MGNAPPQPRHPEEDFAAIFGQPDSRHDEQQLLSSGTAADGSGGGTTAASKNPRARWCQAANRLAHSWARDDPRRLKLIWRQVPEQYRSDLVDCIVAPGGYTALHQAAGGGHLECVMWLAGAAGAQVDVKDASGWTPLYRACYYNRLDIVEYLVQDACADIEAATMNGWRPLHIAALWNQVQIVQLLLNHGADRLAETTEDTEGHMAGSTAYDIARKSGFPALAVLLQRLDTSPDAAVNVGAARVDDDHTTASSAAVLSQRSSKPNDAKGLEPLGSREPRISARTVLEELGDAATHVTLPTAEYAVASMHQLPVCTLHAAVIFALGRTVMNLSEDSHVMEYRLVAQIEDCMAALNELQALSESSLQLEAAVKGLRNSLVRIVQLLVESNSNRGCCGKLQATLYRHQVDVELADLDVALRDFYSAVDGGDA